jgi:hypothetical protein
MSRCLWLAAELFDPRRSPANLVFHDDGSFTESQQVSAAQVARARRDPAVIALWSRFRIKQTPYGAMIDEAYR